MRADDGIHFTAPGYELIAEKILEMIPPPPTSMP
jgi:lysophospholipase L1-like esterase